MGLKRDVFRHEIIKFIKEHRGELTKTEVVNYMDKELEIKPKKGCSRMTTLEILHSLENDEIIKVTKVNTQLYNLLFNTESEFNKLMDDIDRLQRFVNNFTEKVFKDNLVRFNQDKHFRDFVRLKQLVFYGKITWIAVKIQSYIKSVEDRETLDLRLSRVLLDSNKLNNILTSSNEVLDLLKESKISEKDFFLKS